MNITNEMHFPLDNSVCRVETTCPLARLDNLVAVPSKLMRCSFHSTAPSVESRQLVRSYELWKVFFRLCHVDMHFPLDNSVCRVETTCPLVRLDNLVAVPSKLMRCSFHSTAPFVESRQLVRSCKLWKVFFHLCHVDCIGHDCRLGQRIPLARSLRQC